MPPVRTVRAASPSSSEISDGDPPGYEQHYSLSLSQMLGYDPAPGIRRNYEELEDIHFANQTSFKDMAFAIAAAQGTTLVVSDDRSHKSTSAYMHITCSFRAKTGCPFILKLTKAKEGGWVLKHPRSTDVDPKQRSVYKCRHTPLPEGQDPAKATTETTSFPGGPGTKPKAAKKTPAPSSGKKELDPVAKPAPKAVPKAVPVKEPKPKGRMSNTNARSRKEEPQEDEDVVMAVQPSPDRALAPPFKRSLNLEATIKPALSHSPSTGAVQRSFHGSPPLPVKKSGKASVKDIKSRPASDSHILWARFFEAVNPELVSLAEVLAQPKYDCTPDSIFRSDEKMRVELMDMVDVAVWPKMMLKKAVNDEAAAIWKKMRSADQPRKVVKMEGVESTGKTSARGSNTSPKMVDGGGKFANEDQGEFGSSLLTPAASRNPTPTSTKAGRKIK
ncbi:hypothetical protein MNV49_006733 [Pseudohyphozyma bogoriensis]|nr:hypothetical protein MNV49_006733 [Pseudohyphozyma bogoriensis]